jgi:hypothetical protein
MENLIKELKRRQEKENEYQLDLLNLDNTSYKSVEDYRNLADELAFSDVRMNQIDEIIFYLENSVWQDEINYRIIKY